MTVSAGPLSGARPWRLHEWPGRVFDVGVVVGLLLVGAAIVVSSTNQFPGLGGGHIPLYAVGAVALAGLLARRRYPLLTLALILAAVVVDAALGSEALVVPLVLVGVYTVAARLPWRISLPLATLSLVTLGGATAVAGRGGDMTWPRIVVTIVPVGAAYVVGIYAGTRTAYLECCEHRLGRPGASKSCAPSRPSARSECGSRVSSTTSSHTTSR